MYRYGHWLLGYGRWLLVLVVPLLVVPFVAPAAAAHQDKPLTDGTLTVAPGEAATETLELHYHRIVGRVLVTAPEDVTVSVLVDGPDGTRTLAGPGSDLKVNALVPCCKGSAWTEHTIRIVNHGEGAATVEADLVALHDGIAVTGENAETGLISTMVVMLGLVSVLAGRRLRRRVAVLGVFMGAGSVVAFAFWSIEYGHLLAPALLGVASAALPLGVGVWRLRERAAEAGQTP